MTTDVHRRILKGIRTLAPDITIELRRARKHIVFQVSRPGVPARTVSVANTPKNKDHAVLNAVEDARRCLGIGKNSIPSTQKETT